MSERICPECGADTWRAANYDEVREARDRHWTKNQEQAIVILRLQLRVAELEEWQKARNGKIERQRKTIRRLEETLRSSGVWPHANKRLDGGEGDPVSPAPAISTAPPDPNDLTYASPRGARKLRRNAEKAKAEAVVPPGDNLRGGVA